MRWHWWRAAAGASSSYHYERGLGAFGVVGVPPFRRLGRGSPFVGSGGRR